MSFQEINSTFLDIQTPISFTKLLFATATDYEVSNPSYLSLLDNNIGYDKTNTSTNSIRFLRHKNQPGNAYQWFAFLKV
ncbi:hypothetical protein [Veillonella magna]|uniref:hypothetical protein n=1 Tax=Veillonella magna TaxID=464322 RepID=UPI0023F49F32|nr:hypothetical protein [Veillonella magna]